MKKLILFSILILTVYFGFSQQKSKAELSGKITDANTGQALVGASIVLVETKVGTITDPSGNYLFHNIPSGHALIEISSAGYRSIVEHVDIYGTMQKDYKLVTSIIETEGVTITAVGAATSIRKAPISITRVNKEELLATPSSNIIDALRKQPGVSQLTTGPAISKPIIRGLGYNRLVVINDGLRQEGQQWGDEHGIEIDENSVSRIEIVKGPASLIYGSDALAGVVNIITTAPTTINTVKASILSSYGTNNKQRSIYGNIGGNQNGFNWNLWGDYKAAADYKNKYDGYVWNSKFNEKNIGGYIGYNGAWGYSHLIISRFNQKVGLIEGARDDDGNFIKTLAGGVKPAATKTDFNSIDPQIPYQHIYHTKITLDNSFKAGTGKVSLILGLQRNQRQEFGNPDMPGEKALYFDLHTFNYTAAYHLKDHNGWNTSLGVNGMSQNNKNKGLEVLIPTYDLFDIGEYIYTQKTIGKSTLSGGIRYDNRQLTSKKFSEGSVEKFGAFKKIFSNFSSSVGISYAATHNFVIKLNLARGFRAPSIPELASNGAHAGTNRYEYGDVNLRSETSWQGDLGIELNSEHVLFSASTFYNHISNFIFYSKLAGSLTSDSLVEVDGALIPAYKFAQRTANLAGFEALLDLHPHPLDWLHIENTISYVRGKFVDPIEGTRNVPSIPATHWIAELRGEFLKNGKVIRDLALSMEVDHTFNQEKPFLAFDTETATQGYSLLNAGITAKIIRNDKTLCSIYLLGNNITDVAYQNHLSRLKYTDINASTGRQGVFNVGRNFVFRINIPMNITTKGNNK